MFRTDVVFGSLSFTSLRKNLASDVLWPFDSPGVEVPAVLMSSIVCVWNCLRLEVRMVGVGVVSDVRATV